MSIAGNLELAVTSGSIDADGRSAGLWTVDYASGQRCAEILHSWVTSIHLWYEDGTPAACYTTDRVGEFNGPLVRWHPNGAVWEQATFGDNEDIVGTHLIHYDHGGLRAKGWVHGPHERYAFWHIGGEPAADVVDGEVISCQTPSGDAMDPAAFLNKYQGQVIDVMPTHDGGLGVHIQGPTENSHELDGAVIIACNRYAAGLRSQEAST